MENNENKGFFPPFPWMRCGENDNKECEWPKPPFWNEENKEGCENGFCPFPWVKCGENGCEWPKPPFPPFAEEKKEECTDEEKKENVPPFVEFFKNMKKPKLSHEEVEKILDNVQDWLSHFYDAEKVTYSFVEEKEEQEEK